MNVYSCNYYWYKRGAFDDVHLIISAECESVALGLALESEPCSRASDWTITPLDTSERCVYEISRRSS
jgi:hypothetical protein